MTATAGQRPQNSVVKAIAGRNVRNGPLSATSSSAQRAAKAANHMAAASSQRAHTVRQRAMCGRRAGDGGRAASPGQDAIRSMLIIQALAESVRIQLVPNRQHWQAPPGRDHHAGGGHVNGGTSRLLGRDADAAR